MMMLPLMSAGLLLRVERKDGRIGVRSAFPRPAGRQILYFILFFNILFKQDEKGAIVHTHRHTLPLKINKTEESGLCCRSIVNI